jgi:hypothetical protein
VQLHDWVLAGYAGARELTDGVGSMGANVTRDGLVKWLNGLQNYTNGDLVTPHDYTWPYDYSQPAPQCFSVAKWDDSAGTMKQVAPVSTCYTMPWVGYQPLDDGS